MRLLLFITLFTTLTYGQSQLTINNPAPRLGDDLDISVTFKENDERIGNGNFKFSQTLTDTGPLNIGPFKFIVGGKTYETDMITINVSPQLPSDIKDGLWIRIWDFKGEKYLIIEQRVSNQWKTENKSNSEVTWSHGDGVKFAEFKQEILENNGLTIISSSWSTCSQVLDKTDLVNGTVSYKMSTYKFEKTNKFNKRIKIDKKSFDQLPDHIKIEEVWID